MVMTLAGWYFVWVAALSWMGADPMGPYPTQSACIAAREGAREFGGTTTTYCTNDARLYDDMLLYELEIEEMISQSGGPT